MLIGDLYGVSSTKPDYRQKVREKTKTPIEIKFSCDIILRLLGFLHWF